MVIIEKNVIPKNCISLIKNLLGYIDYRLSSDINKADFFTTKKFQGLSADTSNIKLIHESKKLLHTRLNDFAFMIANIICERRDIKIKNITRVMWNLYRPGDEGLFHKDAEDDEKKFTILYSLNTSDGYLIVNKEKFLDVENEAKIFKSNTLHKGVGPTNDAYRLNVNIVLEHEDY
tara:strand:+ start:42 stop:569 length:528 start_codon:yes stop_codon:yes gene_type:complete